jgi:hypothetical protein
LLMGEGGRGCRYLSACEAAVGRGVLPLPLLIMHQDQPPTPRGGGGAAPRPEDCAKKVQLSSYQLRNIIIMIGILN